MKHAPHTEEFTPAHPITVGGGGFVIAAGPCAVEDRDGLMEVARGVRNAGAAMLRGGAFKPRTSPRSFQGLGATALELLAQASALTGLPVVTEVLDPRHVAEVAEVASVLQIGARSMQNVALLQEAGATGLPILLKRHFGATLDEFVGASEYIRETGNDLIILCERGIRTFETTTRFTLDIAAVAALRQRSDLPIFIDPSHAAGTAELVEPLALAAAAAGADGLLVEVHHNPKSARSDGAQSLNIAAFARLAGNVAEVADLAAVRAQRAGTRSISVANKTVPLITPSTVGAGA